jgi:hypothetical protein
VSMFDLSNFTSFSTNDSFSVTSQSPVSRLFYSDANKLYFEEIGGVRRFETDQTPQVVLRERDPDGCLRREGEQSHDTGVPPGMICSPQET